MAMMNIIPVGGIGGIFHKEYHRVPEPITVGTAILAGLLATKEVAVMIASKFQRDKSERDARAEEHHDDVAVVLSNTERIQQLEADAKSARADAQQSNLARISALEEKLTLHRTLIDTQSTLKDTNEALQKTLKTLQDTQDELKHVQAQVASMSIDMLAAKKSEADTRAAMDAMSVQMKAMTEELRKYEEQRNK